MKKYSSITRVNSHRISRTKRIRQVFVVVITAALLVWWAPRLVGGVAAVVMTPIQYVETWIIESSGIIPSFVRDRTTLTDEIATLEHTITEHTLASSSLSAVLAENRELRRLQTAASEERILAGVIGRPPLTPYDSLVLDRGSQHGVHIGAPVYAASTTVIGVVTNVFPRSATAELISSPGFTTSVYVYGPNIYTNAEGIGGGVLRVGVPQGIALAEGNPVILPAVTLGVFGTISLVESNPSSPEQYGYVTTDIPLQSLRLVSVGRSALADIPFEEAREQVDETITALFEIDIPDDILVDIRSTSTATSTASTTNTIIETREL